MSSRNKSPFPGMNPFLEVDLRWDGFHAWFIRELARLNMSRARDLGYWISVERNFYRREPTGQAALWGDPDDLDGPDFTDANWDQPPKRDSLVAIAEPKVVHEVMLDPTHMEIHKQDYVVVRESGRFERILAVLELLSFANKSGIYAPRYREKRMRLLTSGVHFVEIDLLRGGENPSREMFPELAPTPYFIFVARKTGRGRNEEAYPLRLQDRLPVIGLPIGPGRADLPLDLAAAFESAFNLGIHSQTIDYGHENVPEPALTRDDAEWVKEIANRISEGSEHQ